MSPIAAKLFGGVTIIGLLLAGPCIATAEQPHINPFSIYPFKISEDLPELQNYRQNFTRLTGFEYSGLHWNQFISIYVNQSSEIYINNYFKYLKEYHYEFDDEFVDDMKKINQSMPTDFKKYPVGTVFIKENYTSQEGSPTKAENLTIMIKHRPGYDPENGDWEYLLNDLDGQIIMRGKMSAPEINSNCANCHNNIRDRDFIFSTFYSPQHH